DIDVAAVRAVRGPDDLALLVDQSPPGQFLQLGEGIGDADRNVGDRLFDGRWRLAAKGLAIMAVDLFDEDGLGRRAPAVCSDDDVDSGRINRAHERLASTQLSGIPFPDNPRRRDGQGRPPFWQESADCAWAARPPLPFPPASRLAARLSVKAA